MKNIITAAALLWSVCLFAQSGAPRGFHYQAVPRKADGSAFAAGAVLKVRFQIREGSAEGPLRYAEDQILTVSQQGVVSATVGTGDAVASQPGNMEAVAWGAAPHFLAVSVDLNEDGIFDDNDYFGASQLLSVPYALYAQTSGDNTSNPDGPDAPPGITGSGTTGYLPKFTGSTAIGNSVAFETGGKIGIGNTTPQEKLHVSGNIKAYTGRFTGLETNAITVNNQIQGNTYGLFVQDDVLPAASAYFKLGSSNYKWSQVWSTTGYILTSDARFKKDIKALPYGLKEIMQLRPVSFQWADECLGRKPQLGFIAQDLQGVLKEVVRDEEYIVTDKASGRGEWKPTASLGVDYSEIIPVAVQAIQEQQRMLEQQLLKLEALQIQNENLKAENARLKSEGTALEARVRKLESLK